MEICYLRRIFPERERRMHNALCLAVENLERSANYAGERGLIQLASTLGEKAQDLRQVWGTDPAFRAFRDWVVGQFESQEAGYVKSHRQTCKVCLRPDKFNFHVPDEIWEEVVPLEYQNHVVCLACFDDLAMARRVDYATHLAMSLWFAGDAATFEFRVTSAIPSG